jgi:hypothetical protein
MPEIIGQMTSSKKWYWKTELGAVTDGDVTDVVGTLLRIYEILHMDVLDADNFENGSFEMITRAVASPMCTCVVRKIGVLPHMNTKFQKKKSQIIHACRPSSQWTD